MAQNDLKLRRPNRFLHGLGKSALNMLGWQVDNRLPDDPKMVVIFAHHTSNWDFFYMILAAFSIGLKPNWMGKKELFRGPLGPVLSRIGGISVDRSSNHNTVELMAEAIQTTDEVILAIAPEGTRSKVDHWRSGFYHIAARANIPIHFAYIDYPSKTAGVTYGLVPSGNLDEDIQIIRRFYQDKHGKFPEKVGEVQFKPVNPTVS